MSRTPDGQPMPRYCATAMATNVASRGATLNRRARGSSHGFRRIISKKWKSPLIRKHTEWPARHRAGTLRTGAKGIAICWLPDFETIPVPNANFLLQRATTAPNRHIRCTIYNYRRAISCRSYPAKSGRASEVDRQRGRTEGVRQVRPDFGVYWLTIAGCVPGEAIDALPRPIAQSLPC
jgi:hypothetical protein